MPSATEPELRDLLSRVSSIKHYGLAMWLAIITRLGPRDGSVTAEMKANFLSGAREEDILCHARVLKLGRRLIYGVGECRNREGKLLTHSTITYIRSD